MNPKLENQFCLTLEEQKKLNKIPKEQSIKFTKSKNIVFKTRNEYMRNYLRIKRNTNPDNTKVIWRKNVKYPKDFQMCSVCHLIKFRKSNFYFNQYICKSCRSLERIRR